MFEYEELVGQYEDAQCIAEAEITVFAEQTLLTVGEGLGGAM